MTRKDIIRMAREAGLDDCVSTGWPEELERFAALVVANTPHESSMAWRGGFEAGAAVEREACAREGLLWGHRYAAAIRARGQT